MQLPSIGQRWISSSEASLGLGVVDQVEGDRVHLRFPAAEERRVYAFASAPLIRVRFEIGDLVANRSGRQFLIESVSEQCGTLIYKGAGMIIPESELLDTLNFIKPEKRLLAGMMDHPRDFDQRVRAMGWNGRVRQSFARGFAGARMDLIPHQLAIVAEAAGRMHPRVMLADEVGLGKTVEACLIMHHLRLTGRASRVLVLVPESLIHQWFIELLRRFNLLFSIFDEDRCASIEANDEGVNPFLDSQLVLASVDFLSGDGMRGQQAREAGFEVLIVDEAHHLEWSESGASAEYELVESLALHISCVILLTATPQQLGPAGHFARLRLLDPDRYRDFEHFLEEAQSYGPLATVVDALREGQIPNGVEEQAFRSPRAMDHYAELKSGNEAARLPLISELIDSFGTGRVLFRNTREHLSGFPERLPHLYPLQIEDSPYSWLAKLLRSLPEEEKVLLITSSPEAAIAVQEKLLEEIQVESALFHEDLTLLQRDRNAAWFADPVGARILMCSEIGSEGRNFQFARHLVLFGLPRDPELLEQRIGRLDRIGQTGSIHIHVPYGLNSRSEYHARWLHEGLDAFRRPLKGATTLASALLPKLDEFQDGSVNEREFQEFLQQSRDLKEQIIVELSTGHDRLLELGAPSVEKSKSLFDSIQQVDSDMKFERFVVRLFDHMGLDVSDLFSHSYHFHRGQRHSEPFADLPEEGLSVTFDRSTALAREDLAFMSIDHPVFLGALDQYLDGESGNASFGIWKRGKGKAVLLECVFVLESLAPTRLHLDRFLPPTVLRVTVDHQGKRSTIQVPTALLELGDPRRLVSQDVFRQELFPKMLDAARSLATEWGDGPLENARQLVTDVLGGEIARLKDLAQRNPQVSESEILALRELQAELFAALDCPRIRLDGLRLIWCV